jgi:hypothetical protein
MSTMLLLQLQMQMQVHMLKIETRIIRIIRIMCILVMELVDQGLRLFLILISIHEIISVRF